MRKKVVLYLLLLAAWVLFTVHYWAWLWQWGRVDGTYLVVETWMLWSFTMGSLVALLMIRDIER